MNQPTILIADDDAALMRALTIRLRHAGYNVVQAPDGRTAAEIAARLKPDLLLLDVHMPTASGLQAIESMDEVADLNMIPVIYITGDTSTATQLAAERRGAMGVLHKPVDEAELLDTVSLLVGPPGLAA